ncbi:type III-B CRISPR module-associated protein Cmr5 [Vibrio spartinae]|uniref:CRISPR type III-B/RAMP module-associated protein Cmr5 n=1 Tax=Vibrio spartinae TaxID=1918945 RepID=A0A1N6MAP0_9VIBR|nr:type III-B CRISPR module-associated protein Cmr5 [Vibrio spartinae]SIO96522.1 CRISPR system Cmr subunit Cmr5 [Vibrio spartinae]
MQPRSQIIASKVYDQIKAREDTPDSQYNALVKELPSMILQNGLVQATGFLWSKYEKEPHFKKVLDDLRRSFQSINEPSAEAFHNKLVESKLYDSIRYTREALEIAGWMRRYVQGILDPKEKEKSNQSQEASA